MPLTQDELYGGIAPEQAERYEREGGMMYDPALVEESHRRLRKLTEA